MPACSAENIPVVEMVDDDRIRRLPADAARRHGLRGAVAEQRIGAQLHGLARLQAGWYGDEERLNRGRRRKRRRG